MALFWDVGVPKAPGWGSKTSMNNSFPFEDNKDKSPNDDKFVFPKIKEKIRKGKPGEERGVLEKKAPGGP